LSDEDKEKSGYQWTNIGADALNNHNLTWQTFVHAADKVEWKKKGKGVSEALSPAMAINEAVKEFKIPATHYAISNKLAPFGLIGVRGRHRNGIRNIFFFG